MHITRNIDNDKSIMSIEELVIIKYFTYVFLYLHVYKYIYIYVFIYLHSSVCGVKKKWKR